ncbi:hypothetical protein ACIG47_02695 [Promicromonospora sp. NPDC052451]|uniref:hypothetical protein n=1 Tax=Promicromonospora sp. NPDC052451 TaxID=3364407 RepID=UPI0037C8B509
MRRSLISGATAVGMVLGAFVTPAVAAESRSAAECSITVWGEAEAAALAEACDEDVEVLGGAKDGTRLFAEPGGTMRAEVSSTDPFMSTRATARTALSPGAPAAYGWTGTQWLGYCDPGEYADGCDVEGVQRLAWQFDGLTILQDLAPGDVTSAELVVRGQNAWLDDVSCTPSRLDLYDIPPISAGTGWAATATWTQDRRVGDIEFYWPACEQTPAYTGYFDFDATQLAVNAVRDNRSTVTAGLRAADETCMTCGWNSFKPDATLIVRFSRAPLAPTGLEVGVQGSTQACTTERALRTLSPYLSADIRDPDPANSTDPGETARVTATFSVARADAPGVVLWQGPASGSYDNRHTVAIPSGILEGGTRYVWSVFGTDDGGLVGPAASCTFTVDITAPAAPVVTPVVGGQAVYVEGAVRGGIGVRGSFRLTTTSDDVAAYRYGVNTQTMLTEVKAGLNAALSVTPTRSGLNYVSVEAIDRAGNRSRATVYEFYVSYAAPVPSPPAITVSGPTSYTFGSKPSASVTLSADAVTPYGTVTVTSGSATLGSAVFDERTEQVALNGSALGAGTRTLTFTYRAFPGAPAWSTQRTVTVKPLSFSVPRSPSISGTAQVGKVLTANRWTWTPTPTTVRYQWRVNGVAVAGATSSTWKVPASAQGKKVTVAVTGSRFGYATRTVVSPATAAVKAGTFVVPALKITGTAKVGYTLKAVRGTWTPQPSVVKYQWKVGGVVVKGATGSSFKVPVSAKGKRIVVVVTGSRAGYTTRTVSALTPVVP